MSGAAVTDRQSTRASIGTGRRCAAFTLVELLVVLTVLALLASIVTPMVHNSIVRAEEAALKENLHVLRKAIDDYYADNGSYPPTLDVLVARRYVRFLPKDPVVDSEDDTGWHVEYSDDGKGIRDVRSRSGKTASDGTRYEAW